MRGEFVPDKTRWIGNPIGPWQQIDAEGRRVKAPATTSRTGATASYAVAHYDLTLSYNVDTNQLRGKADADRRGASTDLRELRSTSSGLRVTKVTVDGAGGAVRRRSRSTWSSARDGRSPPGASFRVVVRYGGQPRPVPDGDGECGWEELDDGVLVAGQTNGAPSWFPCNDRPDDKATYRIELTAPNAYHVVANGVCTSQWRSASTTTWVYEQREPMATYLATVQIGRYVVHPVDGRVGADAGGAAAAAAPPTTTRAFGRQPRDARLLRAAVRAVPVRRVHRGGHRRRARDPARGAGDVDLRLQPPDLRLGQRAARRARAGAPVVRQRLTLSALARHLAARGLRLLLRVAVVGGVGRPLRGRAGARPLDASSPASRRTCCSPTPARTSCSTTGSTSAARCCCTRCGSRSATTAFFALLRTWVERHRYGSVTTAMFESLAAEVAGSRSTTCSTPGCASVRCRTCRRSAEPPARAVTGHAGAGCTVTDRPATSRSRGGRRRPRRGRVRRGRAATPRPAAGGRSPTPRARRRRAATSLGSTASPSP